MLAGVLTCVSGGVAASMDSVHTVKSAATAEAKALNVLAKEGLVTPNLAFGCCGSAMTKLNFAYVARACDSLGARPWRLTTWAT